MRPRPRHARLLAAVAVLLATLAVAPPAWSAFSGRTAAPSATFAAAVVFAPRLVTPPATTGDARVGSALTATPGTWARTPSTTSIQWQRCASADGPCGDVPGATEASYAPAPSDVGQRLRVAVAATNAAGTSRALSAATARVAAPSAPVALAAPAVTGTAAVGQALTGDPGSWTGASSYAYQWLRCPPASAPSACLAIAGATSSTYAPAAPDVGAALRLRVVATGDGGTTTATSAPTDPVAAAPPAPAVPPSVSGVAQEGQTLTASDGSWTSEVAYVVARTWLRCDATGGSCSTIAGATAATYAATGADAGATLRVRATATNASAGGASADAESAPTRVVVRAYEDEVLADAPIDFLRMRGSVAATAGPDAALTGPSSSWEPGAVATDPADRALGLNVPASVGPTAASLDDATFRQAATVELWFRSDGRAGALLVQQSAAPFTSYPDAWVPELYVGCDLRLYAGWSDGEARQVLSPSTVGDGLWHQAVVERAPAALTLFLDGERVGTVVSGGPWYEMAPGAASLLGNGWTRDPPWPQTVGGYFDWRGSIDEVSLYDHPLSPDRVAAHWLASGRGG